MARFLKSVVKMTLSNVEIGLDTTFALLFVVHMAILVTVLWHFFKIWDEEKTGRIIKANSTELNVRAICLGAGASSSGFDFSSISSVHDTNSKLISQNKFNTACF